MTRAHLGDRSDPAPAESSDAGSSGGNAGRYSSRYSSPGGSGNSPPDGASEELAGYYANLEIPYGSDLHTVRAARKRLMKRYHPDLHGEDAEKRQVAGELTAELTRAYQELVSALERGQDGNVT